MASKFATKTYAAKSTPTSGAKPVQSSASCGMSIAPQVARPAAMPTPAPMSHETIAQRAREISKSGKGGSDLQNWLQAEKEVKARR